MKVHSIKATLKIHRLSAPIRMFIGGTFGVAFLLLLAAIYFPVFASAREKARQATCIRNNKEIGLAILLYAQDYGEEFPTGRTIAASTGGANSLAAGVGWAGQVYPYLKNVEFLHCLTDSTSTIPATDGTSKLDVISYSYNYNIAGGKSYRGATISSMSAPAVTVMLTEVKGNQANVATRSELPSSNIATYSSAGDGINYLYWNDRNENALKTGGIRYDTGVPAGYDCDVAPNPPIGCTGFYGSYTYNGRHAGRSVYFLADGHARSIPGMGISAGIDAPSSDKNQTVKNGVVYAAGTSVLGKYTITYSTK